MMDDVWLMMDDVLWMMERLPKMEKEIRELRKNYTSENQPDIDSVSIDDTSAT